MRFFNFTKKQIRIIAIAIAAAMIVGAIGLFIGLTNVSKQKDSSPKSENKLRTDSMATEVGADDKAANADSETADSSRGGGVDTPNPAKTSTQNQEAGSANKPAETPPAQNTITCTVFVSCINIANNIDRIDAGKRGLIPSDGVLMPKTAVQLNEGSTAFDALAAATAQVGVHLEYTGSPSAKTAYIEGIGNIYQFDCGPLSGWLYSVNGSYPGVGLPTYALKDGDAVELRYTLDLGSDLGAPGIRQ